MATLLPDVDISHQRKDGTYKVSIRVTHQRKIAFIKTPHYVSSKQLKKEKGKVTRAIRDTDLKDLLEIEIIKYRKKLLSLGNINRFNARELANRLDQEENIGIDFIDFGYQHAEKLEKAGKESYASSFKNTLNSLKDYFERDNVSISEITLKELVKYEEFLKSARKITRMNKGKLVTTENNPMKQSGAAVYLTNIRTLFNQARKVYNDEENGRILIPHYPFSKFKIEKGPEPPKRSLEASIVRSIREMKDFVYMGTHGTNRASLARDVFMLSFYMVGINVSDLYNVRTVKDGRLEYKRQKTKSRRKDEAFISIKIEPEAWRLFEKYKDPEGKRVFRFYQMYADSDAFGRNVNKGLKRIAKKLNINEDLTTYYARHSWGTIARNKCGVSKDDVHLALNHVDQGLKVTDIYIEKDWSLIDAANQKVLHFIANE